MLSFTETAVTVEAATAYLDAIEAADWPDSTAEREAAILRGQRHLAREYNQRWADEWANDEAPELVQHAIAEAALVEARTPGITSRVVTPSEAKVLTRVGSLQWQPVRQGDTAEGMKPRLTHVEAMLRPVLRAKSIFLERA